MERLEGRELLAYTPLGFSLPDLSVTGFTAPASSWGGALTVTVDVKNTGASTLVEPLALTPGAPSTADALPTVIGIYASSHAHSLKGAIQIGTIFTPTITQDSVDQITQTLILPNRPAGFPGDGGKIYITPVVNPAQSLAEFDYTNNKGNTSPVQIEAPFPEVVATGIDIPPVIQAGDTIQPNIHIANLGTAATNLQGPITVALVASLSPTFGPGSAILADYILPNIPPITQAPSKSQVFGEATLNLPSNVVTITGAPVQTPATPGIYYLGVVVDPFNQIKQLHKIGLAPAPKNPFSLVQRVGPPIVDLPPASEVLIPGGGLNNLPFPNPNGIIPTGAPIGSNFTSSPPLVNFPQNTISVTPGGTLTTTTGSG